MRKMAIPIISQYINNQLNTFCKMKKFYVLLMVLLLSVAIIGCDKDECPICHECECICN
jgi:hypothetical protein